MVIKYTKKGQRYKILANGRARFLKLNSTNRKVKSRGVTMAKRKKSFKSFARKSAISGLAATVLGAGLYGSLRERMSTALSPMLSKIPMGNISDEVGMGLVMILAKRFIGNKVPLVKDIANAGLVIESARIGVAISTGQVMNSSSNNQDLFNGGVY